MADVDLLADIAIPILVGVFGLIGALIGIFWDRIQAWNKSKIFEKLLLRELEEISPYNEEPEKASNWTQFIPNKDFIHPRIFKNETENRDFILG